MYRIRLHGRGGQGMKTAGRILGTAFFLEGFEVQDAPRYGAERRGAPLFAYVRAAREPIHERGDIRQPALVVVADDTLVSTPGVLAGITEDTVVLINSLEPPATWKKRLNITGAILTLPAEAEDRAELRFIGATCAAAAARLTGAITSASLEQAIRDELADMSVDVVATNLEKALAAYAALADHAGCVVEKTEVSADTHDRPAWVDLPCDDARISAPNIHAAATSVQVRTGLWRTMRPVIDHDHCRGCSWICSTLCPDGAISVTAAGRPDIDYDHCKGCLVCVAVCPHHAIAAVPEHAAAATEDPRGTT
jgi:pyruvate ferredoxin oxidoreductase gamma subunit